MNEAVLLQLFSERIKLLDLSFHLKNRKVKAGREAKALLEAGQLFKGSRNQEVLAY